MIDPDKIYQNNNPKPDIIAILGCYDDGCEGKLYAVLWPCSWLKTKEKTFSSALKEVLADQSNYSYFTLRKDALANTLEQMEQVGYELGKIAEKLSNQHADAYKIIDLGFDDEGNLWSLVNWNIGFVYKDEIDSDQFRLLEPEMTTCAELRQSVSHLMTSRPRLQDTDDNFVGKQNLLF